MQVDPDDLYYDSQSGLVRVGAIISGIFGLDDASHNLRHFLGRSGDAFDELPVDKMIQELPLFQTDITEYVGYELAKKFSDGDFEPIEESGDYSIYAFPTDWRYVGIGGAERDIYQFSDKSPPPAEYIWNLLTATPPEGVEQDQYDWFNAMNKFFYYVRVNVIVNNMDQESQITMQVVVEDHYGWYDNELTGEVDKMMANIERHGYGRNFAISGESSVITVGFNVNDLGNRDENPFYVLDNIDWNYDA